MPGIESAGEQPGGQVFSRGAIYTKSDTELGPVSLLLIQS